MISMQIRDAVETNYGGAGQESDSFNFLHYKFVVL